MNKVKFKFPVKSLLVVSALVCGLVLESCGGGSDGSKLKDNEYLGNLPALYDSYNAEKTALEKKTEEEGNKLMAGGEKNYDKVQKLFDDADVAQKELEAKFKEEVAAQMAGIAGKDVPVTYSAALGTPFYTATVKMAAEKDTPQLSITLTAKDAFTVPSMKGYDYMVYFRLVDAAGTPLGNMASTIIAVKLAQEELSFATGDVLVDSYMGYRIALSSNAASLANFAGVEFITKEEYDTSKK